MRISRRSGKSKGYALIAGMLVMVLLLAAFFAILLVSILQISEKPQDHNIAQAQSNARAGLYIAIGQLKKFAAEDRTTTASSDIFDFAPTPEIKKTPSLNPHFTTVWNAKSPKSLPQYLISGNEKFQLENLKEYPPGFIDRTTNIPDPSPTNDSVWLLTNREAKEDAIKVIKQKVNTHTSEGHYAYWVADQGAKAAIIHPAQINEISGYPTKDVEHLSRLIPGQPDFSIFDANHVPSKTASQTNTEKYFSHSSLPLLGFHTPTHNAYFHDLTSTNLFVLSNSQSGGLKKDLSFLKTLDFNQSHDEELALYNNPYINQDFARFIQYRINPKIGTPLKTSEVEEDDPSHFSIHPLIPEFLFKGSFQIDPTTLELTLNYKIELELWNPYTIPLVFNHSINDIKVKVSNLPNLAITNISTGESLTYKLKEITQLYDRLIPLGPGAINHLQYPRANSQETSIRIPLTKLPGLPEDTFSIKALGATPKISFHDITVFPEQEFLSISLQSQETDFENGLYYYFKYKDDPATLDTWLTQRDIRQPKINLDTSQSELEAFYAWSTQTPDLQNTTPSPFDSTDRIRPTNITDGADNFSILDIPTSEVISVAALREIYFTQASPFSIGQPNANDLNSLFDQYFFSTLPYPNLNWDKKTFLPNTHFVYSKSTQDQLNTINAAQNLFLKGGLNVNSTSENAWSALLSGAPTQVTPHGKYYCFYHHLYGSTAEQELQDLEPDEHEANIHSRMHTNSATLLTKADINALANSIVQEIKRYHFKNKHPIYTLQSFVSSGILQKAIDSLPHLNAPEQTLNKLTQATLLKLLAPLLHTRSDTFLIRAYGDSKDIGSSNFSSQKAYCEAIVQRMPISIEGKSHTREMRIIHFRWVDPLEL